MEVNYCFTWRKANILVNGIYCFCVFLPFIHQIFDTENWLLTICGKLIMRLLMTWPSIVSPLITIWRKLISWLFVLIILYGITINHHLREIKTLVIEYWCPKSFVKYCETLNIGALNPVLCCQHCSIVRRWNFNYWCPGFCMALPLVSKIVCLVKSKTLLVGTRDPLLYRKPISRLSSSSCSRICSFLTSYCSVLKK